MLYSDTITVELNAKNFDHFKDLGYDIHREYNKKTKRYVVKKNNYITAKIDDLPPKSGIRIKLVCDYCGKDFDRRFADHMFIKNKNLTVNKDSCKSCRQSKQEELFINNYGVKNPYQIESVKEKIKSNNMEMYGVEYNSQRPEVQQKMVQTNLAKYGVDNPSKNKKVKQKIVDTMMERYGVENIMELEEYRIKISETLTKNNSTPTSKPQTYLHNLLGGKLNYLVSSSILDIAFPEQMVYIEYDGGAHDLSVELGMESREEFKQKELRRYHFLKGLGWRAIFIKSKNDYLPSDEIIKKTINDVVELFNNDINKKYYRIDIGNLMNDPTYGRLRKIRDSDLSDVV